MDYSSASAYVYAKSCGILGRSFIGEKAQSLFDVKTLSELWELVFKSPVPQIPEAMLANHMEYEAIRHFISEYTGLLSNYSKPHEYLVELLRRYEVENLKVISASLSWGEQNCPRIVELGKYKTLHYECWPNIENITKNTVFEWYNKIPEQQNRWEMDYKLDLQEVNLLWGKLSKIHGSSKNALKKYFVQEYNKKNMIWAMRLKVYYNMDDEQIFKHLFFIGDQPSAQDILYKDAIDISKRRIDVYEDWKDWHYASYLNSHEDGEVWMLDPMWVEHKFRLDETKNALHIFHQNPMTDICLVMFFKLKQQELNCIRAAVESLRLHVERDEAIYAAGFATQSK